MQHKQGDRAYDYNQQAHIFTPAVFCKSGGGRQILTIKQYNEQMLNANSTWKCPSCGGAADWDDSCTNNL